MINVNDIVKRKDSHYDGVWRYASLQNAQFIVRKVDRELNIINIEPLDDLIKPQIYINDKWVLDKFESSEQSVLDKLSNRIQNLSISDLMKYEALIEDDNWDLDLFFTRIQYLSISDLMKYEELIQDEWDRRIEACKDELEKERAVQINNIKKEEI